MPDLVFLFDLIGEDGTAMAGGAALGLVFGAAAQRSGFCTRSAVLGLVNGTGLKPLATWAAGLAAAVLAVQLLLVTGTISVSQSRFFAVPQSLSGALIGGGLFGLGMVLARGCVSRHLVLAASGNLRALATTLVIAATGLATLTGGLVPLRDSLGGLASTAGLGSNEVLALAGLPAGAGVIAGLLLAAGAALLALRAGLSPARLAGGVLAGLAIAGGWAFTHALSTQAFEPVQPESLSFIRPLASAAGQLAGADGGMAGLDLGLLAGTLAGALLAAVLSGTFKAEGFGAAGAAPAWRYGAGAVLMGFGGVLAGGCTIGAGFSGGSVLALSALVALAAMTVSAALAGRVLDGAPRRTAQPVLAPAE